MFAKLVDFSELSKLLSVKSKVSADLLSLFGRFGLGRLLCRLSLEKHDGVSAVQLILSLCLFRLNGESVHSIYKKNFYELLDTGKNCYYRMLTRPSMGWRRLLNHMLLRFICILRHEGVWKESENSCLVIDDTTLEKTGYTMERVSRVFDHVQGKCVLGFKLLLCVFFDGKSTIPFDFSIHREKGKKKDFGLTRKQRSRQFSKQRTAGAPDSVRLQECDKSKMDVAIEMIRRAWGIGLRAKYVLCDSWFTCERLVSEVRSIGSGAMHFVGLAKMGNTKYLVHGKMRTAAELVALYERTMTHSCRKYKCLYICLNGSMGAQPVRIFLIRYGRNKDWNILITSDLRMSFVKAFETYQIRWCIEVVNKETRQHLGLGGYQGRDFDGLVADCTLCYMTYMVMALEKRFADYETMEELFAGLKEELMALTLWVRILACMERLLEVLADKVGLSAQQLMADILSDSELALDYVAMAEALERRRANTA